MSDLWEADMYVDTGAGTFPPVRVVRKTDYDVLARLLREARPHVAPGYLREKIDAALAADEAGGGNGS